MRKYRWRRIIEIMYRQERKKFHYFDRKTYKKIYQVWIRARRLGITEVPHNDFARSVISLISRGVNITEMEMNLGELEKHLKQVAEERKNLNESDGNDKYLSSLGCSSDENPELLEVEG